MKSKTLTLISLITLFTALAIPVRLLGQVNYIVTDLGSLGGTFSAPNTINNRGQIAVLIRLVQQTTIFRSSRRDRPQAIATC